MQVNIKWKDGHADSRGRILYHYNQCYYLDFSDCYCVVPWLDVEHTWVDLEDFIAAQKQAREDSLEKSLEDARKALAPTHEANGYKWSEV